MPRKVRHCRTIIAAALALGSSALTASAQKPLAPLPVPETPPPIPPILQSYKPVTAERLKKPEDGDWLMYRRTYDSWGYSPLSQITTENVSRLKPVWSLASAQVEGHEAPPIVNNGVMFVATPGNQLLAMDAKKGDILWRFKRPIPEDINLLHPTSRGVALLGDKVYFAAADAVLIALDAKTGNEVWKKELPYRSFGNTLLTKEWTPLEPGVIDHKFYARGIGTLLEVTAKGPLERNELVSFTQGS